MHVYLLFNMKLNRQELLQDMLMKQVYNIADNDSEISHLYGVAGKMSLFVLDKLTASLVYIGNFIFRLGHNVIFAFAEPRGRVV
jgi:hypothetical protein